MPQSTTHPSWRVYSVIAVMLSLSIGWGIRGNFGHEYGAMLPGMLAATAACLLSGREDWRKRVMYFAFFGALGWAFGGSMSYMKVVSYTHSGDLPSVAYGFWGLFFGGFLWAAVGGAATAYPAVESRDRLTQLFRPLLWVLVLWTVYYFLWEPVMIRLGFPVTGTERGFEREFRQNDPFYWMDADWIPALLALVALAAFDLWDRRFDRTWVFLLFAAGGAALGAAARWALETLGLLPTLLSWTVRLLADLNAVDPDTHRPFIPANLTYNWPEICFRWSDHLGWIFGLAVGLVIYFALFGKWRSGSSLLVHMATGWFVVFLLFPVLLGIRMTPPRNDNWAGILGVFLGIVLYCYRNDLMPVAVASVITGTVGGFGIAFTQMLKLLAMAPGNPRLLANLSPEVRDPIVEKWQHWQGANWHSIVIEQGVGLIYGLGLAVAMAVVASRVPRFHEEPRTRRWTEAFAVGFVLVAVVYVNMYKNINEFTKERTANIPGITATATVSDERAYAEDRRLQARADLPPTASRPAEHPDTNAVYRTMPRVMRAPLIEGIRLSAWVWFNLSFGFLGICIALLLAVHLERRLPFIPTSWLGKGQLLYFAFLWIVVLMNFERAFVSFGEQRLATEWVIFMNAVVVTFMLAFFAREGEPHAAPRMATDDFAPLFRKSVAASLITVAACMVAFTGVTWLVYGDVSTGSKIPPEKRFGPEADWRIRPVVKDLPHR